MKSPHIPFAKYHGAGNDFVCIDDRAGRFGRFETAANIAGICHRHLGVGADGLILLRSGRAVGSPPLQMVYYNSDGAPSSFCGNGARCFLRFAVDLGAVGPLTYEIGGAGIPFVASDGPHVGWVLSPDRCSVSMTLAGAVERLSERDDRVDTGSPHFVRWCSVLPQGDILADAREIRYSPAFAKTGINVNYVTEPREGSGALCIRTYERGVEGETLACGTGVTAAALSFAERRQLTGPQAIAVDALGGSLVVHMHRSSAGEISNLRLEGPTARVFDGRLPLK